MLENDVILLIPIDIEMIDTLLISNKAFFDKYGYQNDGGEYLIPDKKYLLKIKDRMLQHPEEYPLAVDYLIILKDIKTIIGSIYFKSLPIDGECEIGYGMNVKYRGNGYMSITLSMMLEYGRENGVRSVIADTKIDNIKSQNVLLRNGFKEINRNESFIYYRKEL